MTLFRQCGIILFIYWTLEMFRQCSIFFLYVTLELIRECDIVWFYIGLWNCSDSVALFVFSIGLWNCSDSLTSFAFQLDFGTFSIVCHFWFFIFLLDFGNVPIVWLYLFFYWALGLFPQCSIIDVSIGLWNCSDSVALFVLIWDFETVLNYHFKGSLKIMIVIFELGLR